VCAVADDQATPARGDDGEAAVAREEVPLLHADCRKRGGGAASRAKRGGRGADEGDDGEGTRSDAARVTAGEHGGAGEGGGDRT
jgi:hypothetical protein